MDTFPNMHFEQVVGKYDLWLLPSVGWMHIPAHATTGLDHVPDCGH